MISDVKRVDRGNGDKQVALPTLVNHCFAVGSVKICSLNDMVFGVHPVHASPSIIDGQSIGPEEMSIGNDAPV